MSQPTTLVVTASPNPNAPDAMRGYLQGVLPLLLSAGGEIVKRLQVTDIVGGEPSYGMVLVMDFDSKDAASALFESDEYKALIPNRDEGFTNMTINFANEM